LEKRKCAINERGRVILGSINPREGVSREGRASKTDELCRSIGGRINVEEMFQSGLRDRQLVTSKGNPRSGRT